jgi:hypothetical protein
MTAGPLSAVLTGRFIDRDGITGIAGGRVTLHGADGNDYVTYTTEKGYYVLTDIPASLDVQNVDLSFMDSTGVWTRSDAVTLSAGNVTRLDFAHPRTNSVVEIGKSGSADGLRLTRYSHDNGVAENLRDLSFELAGIEDAAAHIDAQLFDVLGRPMRATVLRMNTSANGITFDLDAGAIPSGVYICVVRTADGREASCRVVRK